MSHIYSNTQSLAAGAAYYDEKGLNTLISKDERSELAIEARKAFKKLEGNGATDETFDEFRHRIAINACGRRISEALRGDYGKIAAAFAAISGNTGRAIRIAVRSETEGRRIALVKLTELLHGLGHEISYAAPLLWNFYKVRLEDATSKQLWAVFYEFKGGNKKRGARRKRHYAKTGGKPAKKDPAKRITDPNDHGYNNTEPF